MPTYNVKQRPNGKWRVRWRDHSGRESSRHFDLKREADAYGSAQVAALNAGTYISPKDRKTTVAAWCDTWLAGYSKRESTMQLAANHIKIIKADLGDRQMSSLKASDIRAWVVQLQGRGYAASYVHAVYRRLSQILDDAVHDELLVKSPCSRKTSPPKGEQRAYVATTEQVWALYDALPEPTRPAILLGAFVGLRAGEAVVVRATDVDFMRGIVKPLIQYPERELKTDESKTPIPIPPELSMLLGMNVRTWNSKTIVLGALGRPIGPRQLDYAFAKARATVPGLPEDFRFHDLRHYFASLLIAAGLDIKTVQKRLRHKTAQQTLDVYGHLWPDKDESSKMVVANVLRERFSDDQFAAVAVLAD
ncbi:tyrosine-type recombinase/integrase [Microbacterium sp. GXS0129]|uniref:tyrosine-type recombinase/integrase n=1 Tax=Microbacterium sp. GXS0129 TaxID=3377836 RepID=UPI00383B3E2C